MSSIETVAAAGLAGQNARRAIFLDRDGVLNVEVGYVRSPQALQLLPGAAAAVRRINQSPCLAIAISNQSAVARGLMSEADLDRVHAQLGALLAAEHARLDRIYYCPHYPEKGASGGRSEYQVACQCRKPAPGMILTAAAELNIDLARSIFIGDSTADMVAGARAGCQTVLVRTGYGGRDGKYPCRPDLVFDDLYAAIRGLLGQEDCPPDGATGGQ